jgi:hypothetical protein
LRLISLGIGSEDSLSERGVQGKSGLVRSNSVTSEASTNREMQMREEIRKLQAHHISELKTQLGQSQEENDSLLIMIGMISLLSCIEIGCVMSFVNSESLKQELEQARIESSVKDSRNK